MADSTFPIVMILVGSSANLNHLKTGVARRIIARTYFLPLGITTFDAPGNKLLSAFLEIFFGSGRTNKGRILAAIGQSFIYTIAKAKAKATSLRDILHYLLDQLLNKGESIIVFAHKKLELQPIPWFFLYNLEVNK